MAGEIAMSFVLLVGAGLLIRSFMHLRDVKPGINADHVLTVRVAAPPGKFKRERTAASVLSTGNCSAANGSRRSVRGNDPESSLSGDTFNVGRGYIPEGRPATTEEEGDAAYLPVSPGYFRTLQIPLIAGRAFTDQDTDKAPKVLIINEPMARKLWPGQSPIGKSLAIWHDEKFSREIVGVVGETKGALDEPARRANVRPLRAGRDLGKYVGCAAHQQRTNQCYLGGEKRNPRC